MCGIYATGGDERESSIEYLRELQSFAFNDIDLFDGGIHTSFRIKDEWFSFDEIFGLRPGICPLCLEPATHWHKHHTVWRAEGGTDHEVNLLPICATCHAIINTGDIKDSGPRNFGASAFMLGQHGLKYLTESGLKDTDTGSKINDALKGITDRSAINLILMYIGTCEYRRAIKIIKREIPNLSIT